MGYSDWSEDFSVHHTLMDEQHQTIFRLVNELHTAIFQKKARDVLGDIVQELIDYTERHFAEEENLMRRINFPGYAKHKETHDQLLRQVLDFERKFQAGDNSFSAEMFQFLVSDWLVRHILGMDKQYALIIKKSPTPPCP